MGGVGVETVLEKFFNDAYRTLDYLACGNAVDDIFGEGADLWSTADGTTTAAGSSSRHYYNRSGERLTYYCISVVTT